MNFSVLNLVNDDFSPFKSFMLSFFLDLILLLNFLKSLNFHNFIFPFFLNFIVFPLFFFLFKLPLPNSGSFGIRNHFIHGLNIIKMLLCILHSSIINNISFLFFLSFEFIHGKFLFLFFLNPHHFIFLGFGLCQLMLLFFFH